MVVFDTVIQRQEAIIGIDIFVSLKRFRYVKVSDEVLHQPEGGEVNLCVDVPLQVLLA